jgi:hypothetical protein
MTHHAPRHTVDLDAARAHYYTAAESRTPLDLWLAVADIPVLLAEIRRARSLVTVGRARYADLLAAARATLAAHRDGEADPLYYLHDELNARGQLPPRHLHAADLLAHAGRGEDRR